VAYRVAGWVLWGLGWGLPLTGCPTSQGALEYPRWVREASPVAGDRAGASAHPTDAPTTRPEAPRGSEAPHPAPLAGLTAVERAVSPLPVAAQEDVRAWLLVGPLVGPGGDTEVADAILARARHLRDDEAGDVRGLESAAVARERWLARRAGDAGAPPPRERARGVAAHGAGQGRASRAPGAPDGVEERDARLAFEAWTWYVARQLRDELGGATAGETPVARRRFGEALLAAPTATLGALEPDDPDYRPIARLWRRYRDLAAAARGLPPLRKLRLADRRRLLHLKRGRRAPQVRALRALLARHGLLPGTTGGDSASGGGRRGPPYDEATARAVAAFQRRAGRAATGRLDAGTLRALEVSPGTRAAQLAAVLHHLRRNPARAYSLRVQVNIPGFRLRVFRGGEVIAEHRVIVGSNRRGYDPDTGALGPVNRTPVLASAITELVLNPSWHVPQRIKEEELDVRAARDPSFYDEDYRLYAAGDGRERAVMLPGPNNALGRVKFVFAGGDGVYLHDTPRKALFNRASRALSHGCVRVDRALELARLLLREGGSRLRWDQVQVLLYRGHETPVQLARPIPIFLEYVTAEADEEGRAHWLPDVYGWGPVRTPR